MLDGQPDTGSPKINIFIIITIIIIKSSKQKSNPIIVDNTNGNVLNPTIPFITYLNNFKIDVCQSTLISYLILSILLSINFFNTNLLINSIAIQTMYIPITLIIKFNNI